MKRLLKILKANLRDTILAPLFKMTEAAFELFIPLVVASIIDTGIANDDRSYIISRGILMIILGIAGFGFSLCAQYFSARCAAIVGKELRGGLFDHITSLGYSEIDTIGTSVLLTRMTSDVNQVQQAVNMFLRLFLRSPFIVIGAAIMGVIHGGGAGFIFIIVVPLLFAAIFFILIVTMPLNKKVQSALEKITRSVRENLSGVRVVRAFGRQEKEREEFEEYHRDYYRKQMKSGRISAILNPMAFAAINLGVAAILYVGGGRVYIGELTTGQVVALTNYMAQILVEIIKLANLIILESRGVASMLRIDELMNTKGSISDGSVLLPETGALKVRFENVSFAYGEGRDESLKNISFEAHPGQAIGIIGATGSGKTTLVNLLLRNYLPSEGRITINDTDIKDLKMSEIIRHTAVVPQKAELFKGTLRSNLLMGDPEASDERLTEALDTAEALVFTADKGGLGMPIEQYGSNLSGGQRQRIAIARALAKTPGLLIMDDSFSALDYATDAHLRSKLKKRLKDCTLILISQRTATIRRADNILVLDNGEFAGFGPHKELYRTCPVYREICDSQLGSKEDAS